MKFYYFDVDENICLNLYTIYIYKLGYKWVCPKRRYTKKKEVNLF